MITIEIATGRVAVQSNRLRSVIAPRGRGGGTVRDGAWGPG
jgi:hypothetical protein